MNDKKHSVRCKRPLSPRVSKRDRSNLDPLRAEDRKTLLARHPVLDIRPDSFQIATPPLQRAFEAAVRTIASGDPGHAFYGFPRFGKTAATKYFQHRLPELFPDTPIFLYHAHHDRLVRRDRFYTQLLRTMCGNALANAGCDPLSRLVRACWARAEERGSHRIIFIGDEMQCLSPEVYSWLIDFANDLHELKVRVIAIFFGQPELMSVREVLLQTNRLDIIGRFLSRLEALEGIRSVIELREVMHAYDDPRELEYPAGSGWSFTRFFAPEAFAHGWRLASCAGVCWEAFKEIAAGRRKSTGKSRRLNIGMQWAAGAIRHVLQLLWDGDGAKPDIPQQLWRAAVLQTGWADTLGLIYDPAQVEES